MTQPFEIIFFTSQKEKPKRTIHPNPPKPPEIDPFFTPFRFRGTKVGSSSLGGGGGGGGGAGTSAEKSLTEQRSKPWGKSHGMLNPG